MVTGHGSTSKKQGKGTRLGERGDGNNVGGARLDFPLPPKPTPPPHFLYSWGFVPLVRLRL